MQEEQSGWTIEDAPRPRVTLAYLVRMLVRRLRGGGMVQEPLPPAAFTEDACQPGCYHNQPAVRS